MLTSQFLNEFKKNTEYGWSKLGLDSRIYGGQIQKDTRWMPGLSQNEISAYEDAVGFLFPKDFRTLIGYMNGWTKPLCLTHGKETVELMVGVYAYPNDLNLIKENIGFIKEDSASAYEAISGYVAANESINFLPIFGHRYIVCSQDPETSIVISFMPNDTIIYATDLQQYLEREFLEGLDIT